MRRRRTVIAAAAVLIVVGAVVALPQSRPTGGAAVAALPQPPDSDAPAGAPPHWIPSDEWVMQHWLPYDEERLLRLLDIDRATLWRHLRDDRRVIAQLAARRGWPDPRRLAAKLVAPRRVNAKVRDELEARAVRTLTQGHLAQHMLFHSLHQDAVPDRAAAIFGVSSHDEFQRLRRLDVSPLQIARMNGRSRAAVQGQAEAALRERVTAGVGADALSRRQGRLLLARQLAQLPRWMSESHYNGPPRTDRTGRLRDKPQPTWAAPAMTADGERVVMEAYEPKLPVALARGEISVVGWDERRRATAVSHRLAGAAALPFSAYNPAISGSGEQVVFETSAGNRNFAKRYGDTMVVAADARSGRARVLSGRKDTAYAPTVSADGSTAAFQAVGGAATRAATARGDTPATRIHVRDLARGTARPLPARAAFEPALSGDGRLVAYTDGAHVYVHDRRTERTRRVSPVGGEAWGPRLSADGRAVVFASTAGAERSGESRIYVRNLRTGRLRPVSTVAGRPLPGFASEPAISADGSTVAFSLAPPGALDSLRGAGRPPQRVHVHDLRAAVTRPVSPQRGYAGQATLSADGSRVAFTADTGGPVLRVRRGSTAADAPPSRALTVASSYAAGAQVARAPLCRLRPPAW